MPIGVYDHCEIRGRKLPEETLKKRRKSRETRTCAFFDCNNTFEVLVTSTQRYCNRKCYWKSRKGRPSWNKNLTKETDERIAIQAKKISKALEGHSVSEETREKIRVSNSGENNPKYGKTYEEYYGEEEAKEIKKKLSKSSEGREQSLEARRKMSVAKKGKTFEEIYGVKSEDMKDNLRIKLIGQHFQTKESKERIRQASTERWQDEEYRRECIMRISNAFSMERKKRYSERFTGENNPNWRGGVWIDPYPPEFNEEFKTLIRERDNHTCQLCGKTKEENGRKLDVHHIYYDKSNSDMDSKRFVALCSRCNSKVNFNREYWTKFFESKLRIDAALV